MFTTRIRRFWRNRKRYKQKASSRLSFRKRPQLQSTVSSRRKARLKRKGRQ